MNNYIGYFKSLSNINYSVKIITNSASTAYTEVLLAGDNPFVVTYEDSDTPFSPVRTSTAEINIVSDDYLLDIYPIKAKDVMVQLWNTSTNNLEWCGYLKPYLYNQGYENCTETISLQASDCLASLQYYDYTTVSTYKQIRSVWDIIMKLLNQAGQLEGVFLPSGKLVNGVAIDWKKIGLSERNFFSDDPDAEPWKCDEVLEEICRYFGYTALQWKNNLYFIDNQYFTDTERLTGTYYTITSTGSTTMTLPAEVTIDADAYRGNGGQISFEQVYNKATIIDDFFLIEDLVPDLFEEEYLTNTLGEEWKCEEVPWYTEYAYYVNENDAVTKEDTPDSKYSYYKKPYKHEWYDSVYRTSSGQETTDNGSVSSKIISSGKGQTYTRCTAIFTNNDTVSAHTVDAYAYIRMYWWDPTSQIQDQVEDEDEHTFTLQPCESVQVQFGAVVTDPQPSEPIKAHDNEMMYCVDGGEYIQIGSTIIPEAAYIGGYLRGLANIENGNLQDYNYETESTIDFTNYLMINQNDFPNGINNPRLSAATLDTDFPVAFRLKEGWVNPIVVDNDSFIYIDATAIWERYSHRPYINPDWTGQCTGIHEKYNLYKWKRGTLTEAVETIPPALVFKLGVGNRFWNGSAWTTTDCAFYVDMSTPTNDDGSVDYSAWWNKESHVLNNVSWEDWATDAKGYKIPLDTSLDFNQQITFEVHMPSKLQGYSGSTYGAYGFNSYCWIKDLAVKVAHKGTAKNSDKEDTKYENVIEDGAINEFNEDHVQITTYDGANMVSYSNALVLNSGTNLFNNFLTSITETHLSGVAQKPEENYIEKMATQYGSLTKKESVTVDLSFTPLGRVVDAYWNENFIILGQEIDYAYDRQTISICQLKGAERPFAEFDDETMELDETASSYLNGITANVDWYLTVSQSWMEITNTITGTSGWSQIELTVDANDTGSARTGYIYVKSISDGTILDTCTVLQDIYEEPYLRLTPSAVTFTSGGGMATLTVESNVCAYVYLSGETPTPTPTPVITAITFRDLMWTTDIPAAGGTADKNNCSYSIYALYNNGNVMDITDAASVTGTLGVSATSVTSRHSAGTLTLTATYGSYTDTENVTVWQLGGDSPSIVLDESSISFAASGATATFNITSNIDWIIISND